MSKNLCLYSYKFSSWISCQKIVANLWENYKSASPATSSLHFGPEQKGQELIALAQKIIELKPDSISFIDHRPHPIELLQFLIPMWMKKHSTFPVLIFHIYGDFTLNYQRWAILGNLIKGIKTKFCVASTSQKKLIEKLIPGPIHILPFSVDEKEFFYDEELRAKKRKDLKVEDEEKLFIFSGRLSHQKNIHLLTDSFLKFTEEKNSNAKLLIFGHYDDLGDTFANNSSSIGQYFHQVNSTLLNHPRKNQVHFMGMASSQELNHYYNASDYFISLSTHNDEDFGMSVAEASLCGLASILTAWGGFNDFNFTQNKFLEVSIAGEKKIDLTHFNQYLTGENNYDKQELSQTAKNKFGVVQTSLTLEAILNSKACAFTDFKELFYRVQRTHLYTEKTFLDSEHKLNSLYQELYDSYLG